MDDQPAERRASLAGRPDGGEENRTYDEAEVRAGCHHRGVVPSQLEQRPAEPGRDPRRDRLPHRRRACRRDERDAVVLGELHGTVGPADNELEEAFGSISEALHRALEKRGGRDRGERRALGGLPDNRVAADERERGVPAPDGDREVERADHGDGPERMPGLGQSVPGTLRRNRATVELPREANREVADVDHLLDLAEPLLRDLPDLERDERAEGLLLAPELVAEEADELAPPRGRDVPPSLERGGCAGDGGIGLRLARPGNAADLLACDRRRDGEVAIRQPSSIDAKPFEELSGGGDVDGRHAASLDAAFRVETHPAARGRPSSPGGGQSRGRGVPGRTAQPATP